MATSAEQGRAWAGAAVLGHGFRPFFLLAGLWAVLAMLLWVAMLSGQVRLPTAFAPASWHAHEFLWGYLGAVVTGFLLTAVPNWTGRLPIVGWPLAGLAGLWLAGRAAVAVSAWLPAGVVAAADLALLSALVAVLTREIVAGRNWRNLAVLVPLGLFLLGNALFHVEAAGGGYAARGAGLRLGLAAAVLLVLLVGGRVTPSFTRNWLARQGSAARPAAFGRLDRVALGLAVAALAAWVALPQARASAILCLAAGAATLARLARWQGHRTAAEPLVWVLHLGYGLTALGFLAVGWAALAGPPGFAPAAQHLWMVGGIGTMTLAVMTRASLGHSGRALHASRPVAAIYVLISVAVAARMASGAVPAERWLLDLSAVAWLSAFGGFTVFFWPLLTRPRPAPE